MANELIKKAAEVVHGKLCSVSHDLFDLKSCLAESHPVMVAISKDAGNAQWVKLVQDLLQRAHTANGEALDWNKAIQTDLQG